MEMIDPNLVKFSLTTDPKLKESVETGLMMQDPKHWTPITVSGEGKVLLNAEDSVQRVLVARKHGIKEIPVVYAP